MGGKGTRQPRKFFRKKFSTPEHNKTTYRRQTGASASIRLQAGRGRPNPTKGLGVGEAIRVPGLGSGQIIGIRVVVLERRVQTLETGRLVAGHLILVKIDRHGAVSVKLARGLAVQGLLMPLGSRGTRGGIVIHVRLLVTHGGGTKDSRGWPEECEYVGSTTTRSTSRIRVSESESKALVLTRFQVPGRGGCGRAKNPWKARNYSDMGVGRINVSKSGGGGGRRNRIKKKVVEVWLLGEEKEKRVEEFCGGSRQGTRAEKACGAKRDQTANSLTDAKFVLRVVKWGRREGERGQV